MTCPEYMYMYNCTCTRYRLPEYQLNHQLGSLLASRLASTQASCAARAQGRAPSLVAEDGYFAQNERHFRVVPVHDGAIPTARS